MLYVSHRIFRRLIAVLTVVCFCATSLWASAPAAQTLPQPGTVLSVSQPFRPAVLAGMAIDSDNPFLFDFIIADAAEAASDDPVVGAHGVRPDDKGGHPSLQDEYLKLIKYFFAALTVPEDQMWVNLSPVEPDRIIARGLGQTDMGRDMLAQDYLLKQLTASLLSPDGEAGKAFWEKVYERLYANVGAIHELPLQNNDDGIQSAIQSFNKVWIIPDTASVYVHGHRVFITGSHLKVMLESDYLVQEQSVGADSRPPSIKRAHGSAPLQDDIKSIIRSTILPLIEDEINTGATFANLRQIYNSMILAAWYKKNLKDSLLAQAYVDQNKIEGITYGRHSRESGNLKNTDPRVKPEDDVKEMTIDSIYQQYLAAFRSGVNDVIREEYDPRTQSVIPRKYFTGGLIGVHQDGVVAKAMLDVTVFEGRTFVGVNVEAVNPAMMTKVELESIVYQKLFHNARVDSQNGLFADLGRLNENQLNNLRNATDARTLRFLASTYLRDPSLDAPPPESGNYNLPPNLDLGDGNISNFSDDLLDDYFRKRDGIKGDDDAMLGDTPDAAMMKQITKIELEMDLYRQVAQYVGGPLDPRDASDLMARLQRMSEQELLRISGKEGDKLMLELSSYSPGFNLPKLFGQGSSALGAGTSGFDSWDPTASLPDVRQDDLPEDFKKYFENRAMLSVRNISGFVFMATLINTALFGWTPVRTFFMASSLLIYALFFLSDLRRLPLRWMKSQAFQDLKALETAYLAEDGAEIVRLMGDIKRRLAIGEEKILGSNVKLTREDLRAIDPNILIEVGLEKYAYVASALAYDLGFLKPWERISGIHPEDWHEKLKGFDAKGTEADFGQWFYVLLQMGEQIDQQAKFFDEASVILKNFSRPKWLFLSEEVEKLQIMLKGFRESHLENNQRIYSRYLEQLTARVDQKLMDENPEYALNKTNVNRMRIYANQVKFAADKARRIDEFQKRIVLDRYDEEKKWGAGADTATIREDILYLVQDLHAIGSTEYWTKKDLEELRVYGEELRISSVQDDLPVFKKILEGILAIKTRLAASPQTLDASVENIWQEYVAEAAGVFVEDQIVRVVSKAFEVLASDPSDERFMDDDFKGAISSNPFLFENYYFFDLIWQRGAVEDPQAAAQLIRDFFPAGRETDFNRVLNGMDGEEMGIISMAHLYPFDHPQAVKAYHQWALLMNKLPLNRIFAGNKAMLDGGKKTPAYDNFMRALISFWFVLAVIFWKSEWTPGWAPGWLMYVAGVASALGGLAGAVFFLWKAWQVFIERNSDHAMMAKYHDDPEYSLLIDALNGNSSHGNRSRVALRMATFFERNGEYSLAKSWAEQAIAIGRAAGHDNIPVRDIITANGIIARANDGHDPVGSYGDPDKILNFPIYSDSPELDEYFRGRDRRSSDDDAMLELQMFWKQSHYYLRLVLDVIYKTFPDQRSNPLMQQTEMILMSGFESKDLSGITRYLEQNFPSSLISRLLDQASREYRNYQDSFRGKSIDILGLNTGDFDSFEDFYAEIVKVRERTDPQVMHMFLRAHEPFFPLIALMLNVEAQELMRLPTKVLQFVYHRTVLANLEKNLALPEAEEHFEIIREAMRDPQKNIENNEEHLKGVLREFWNLSKNNNAMLNEEGSISQTQRIKFVSVLFFIVKKLLGLGGIDFNAQKLDLDEQGGKMQLNVSGQSLHPMQMQYIQGLRPVIRSITPIADIRPLLGLDVDADKAEDVSAIPMEKLGRELSEV